MVFENVGNTGPGQQGQPSEPQPKAGKSLNWEDIHWLKSICGRMKVRMIHFFAERTSKFRPERCPAMLKEHGYIRQRPTLHVEIWPPLGHAYRALLRALFGRLVVRQVIVKSIMTGEAAEEALTHGVDAVWVSNHGGRQLDTVPATIEILPEVGVDCCLTVKREVGYV